jgi:hypothetical protein
VRLTVLPALATACATAPLVRDDDAERVDRGVTLDPYGDETPGAEGIALAPGDEQQAAPMDPGAPDYGTGYWDYSGAYVGGYVGGGYAPRYYYRRPIHRRGFGHFFGGGGHHGGGLGHHGGFGG